MTRRIVKPIIIISFLGVVLTIMPFFITRAILLFLILGALFKFLKSRRYRRVNHREIHPGVADVIRYMSEQEYKNYRQKLEAHYYGQKPVKEQIIEIQ
jgi:hypothetical protein